MKLTVNGKEVEAQRITPFVQNPDGTRSPSALLLDHQGGSAWLTADDDIVFTHLVKKEVLEPELDEDGEEKRDRHGNPVLVPVLEEKIGDDGEPLADEEGNPVMVAKTEENVEITHVFPAGTPNREKLQYELGGPSASA